MQVIKDYKTFSELFLKTHKWLENVSEEKREKYLSDDFKSYLMIKTDDDYVIMLYRKPTIDSDLWYDDETPTPDVTLDYFKDYNKMNFKYDYTEYLNNKERFKTDGMCCNFYSKNLLLIGEKNMLCGINYNNSERDNRYFIRELTEDEEQQYLKICDDLKDEYNTRLEKYFNKYRRCIHARGYWVNR